MGKTFVKIKFRTFETKECIACTSPCKEWTDDNTCLSCESGFYLSHAQPYSSTGTCQMKNAPIDTVNVFVRPNYVEENGDGTYINPFGHIAKALSFAYDRAADMLDSSNITINIYLLAGDRHYMNMDGASYTYGATKSDKYSYNKDVTIQPAFWGQNLGGHLFNVGDPDCIDTTGKVIVDYKMSNYFYFDVFNSLTIKNIHFDAIDSSIDPTEICLKENTQCCELSGTTLQAHTDAIASPTCTMFYYQEEKCWNTLKSHLFYFAYDEMSSATSPGTLTIQDSVFENFFYDFNSLIGLNGYNGHIVITGTTFDKFSNWGSIIRDSWQKPVLDYGNTNYAIEQRMFMRASEISLKLLSDKFFGTPKSYCSSATCSSISISTSTFSNFNYMKTSTSVNPQILGASNSMNHQGSVIDLEKYFGPVTLHQNTFTEMKFKYSSCEAGQNIDSSTEFNIYNTSLNNVYIASAYQLKTLVHIRVRR